MILLSSLESRVRTRQEMPPFLDTATIKERLHTVKQSDDREAEPNKHFLSVINKAVDHHVTSVLPLWVLEDAVLVQDLQVGGLDARGLRRHRQEVRRAAAG